MKKIIFLFVLAIFLKPIFPVIEYVVNYDYIVNVLCENKAAPELACNGKCYLMKELAKNADQEKPSSDKSSKKNTVVDTIDTLFKTENDTSLHLYFGVNSPKVNVLYSNLYTYFSSDTTFHPPSFIS